MKKRGLNLPKESSFAGPASIWKRAVAFVMDLLVINLVIMLPFRPLLKKIVPADLSYSTAYSYFTANPGYSRLISIVSIAIGVMAMLYFAILEYNLKQTVGKVLMNVYVISEAKKERFWQYLARGLFLLPVFPFILLWAVDPLFLVFTKKNQRLTEILSKTRVVERYALGGT